MLTWPLFGLGKRTVECYWLPKNVCILISGNGEYVSLYGKGGGGGHTENGIKIATQLTLR